MHAHEQQPNNVDVSFTQCLSDFDAAEPAIRRFVACVCWRADVRVPSRPLADEASSEKRGVESRDASALERKLKRTQEPETGMSRTSGAANHVTLASSFVGVIATTLLFIEYFSPSTHIERRSVRSVASGR